MKTFRKQRWSLCNESDSEEVGKFGLPELKLVLKKTQTPQPESEVWAGKKSGPDLMVDEKWKSVHLVDSKRLHQLH